MVSFSSAYNELFKLHFEVRPQQRIGIREIDLSFTTITEPCELLRLNFQTPEYTRKYNVLFFMTVAVH